MNSDTPPPADQPARRPQGLQLSLLTVIIFTIGLGIVVPLNLKPHHEVYEGNYAITYGFPLIYRSMSGTFTSDGTFELMHNSKADEWRIDMLVLNILITVIPLPIIAFWLRQMFGVKYKDGDAPL